jgi:SAM-dependent methyltransferase
MNKDLLKDISNYYTDKLTIFGNTPKGVDWKDEGSQFIRFYKLAEVIYPPDNYSVNDLGCGYGKLLDVLHKNGKPFIYKGYDVSEKMISSAKELFKENKNAEFIHIKDPKEITVSDYTVASGIFNVKMDYKEKEWEDYIYYTIQEMGKKSKKGLSFNMLTSYCDKAFMREDLYYADPCIFFDFCKKNISKNIVLLHDYDLYEFTILAKK